MSTLYISNPPYNIATDVIESFVKLGNSVVLAPFGKYKKKDLYKYVVSAMQVNRWTFTEIGYNIQPNLLISKLQSKIRKEVTSLIDIESQVWDPSLKKYYLLNLERKASFLQFVYNRDLNEFVRENLCKILFIPYWSHVGNAQSDKSVTKKANEADIQSLKRILNSNQSYCFLLFKSEVERNNALNFWKTDLCNDLLFGNTTRSTLEKFPHIDWTNSKIPKSIGELMELVSTRS